ncbi:MAG: response regulator [Desulfovermiculus sp.]
MTKDTRPKVLIVDDETENIQLLMETLKQDYIITAAKNGGKALNLAGSKNQPDIILLDIMMPGMDGYEVCRRLKAGDQTRDIPVIFVTALDRAQDEVKGLESGAVDYLSKPFKPVIVRARIENHLELHRSQKELRKLRRCVENSPSTIVITDTDGNIEYANPAFTQTTGYGIQEALGHNTGIMKSGMHEDSFYRELWQVITSGRVWRGEFINKKKNGELFWEQASIAPVKNSRDEITNYVAVKEDISARKDLEQLKEDVERIMRHDLKTPLNGIMGVPAAMLGDDNLTDEQIEMLDMIKESGRRMLRMIDMSLDLFKMETGEYIYNPRQVDASALVQAVLNDVAPAFKVKSIQVVINTNQQQENSQLWIKAEEQLLYGILCNLVKNAFEASPEGEQVQIELMDLPCPAISIKNRGVVPEPIRKHFFQKYKTFGKKSGTGLGTYSAKLMANTMGYDLELDISDSRDTTTLTLMKRAFNKPARAKPKSDQVVSIIEQDFEGAALVASRNQLRSSLINFDNAAGTPSEPSVQTNLNILLAEDDRLTRKAMTHFLEKAGYSVTGAETGSEVVRILESNHFDIILMDVQMPEMDGVEATKTIRNSTSGPWNPNIPILALTAYAMAGDREQFIDAGMTDYISKPVDFTELKQKINRLMQNRPAAEESPPPAYGDHPGREEDIADVRAFMESNKDDPEFSGEILKSFPGHISERMARLKAAVENRDAKETAAAAHKFIALFSAVYIRSAFQTSRDLQTAARQGDLESCQHLFRNLEPRMNKIVQYIESLGNKQI